MTFPDGYGWVLLEDGTCKLFKMARIGSMELSAEAWAHAAEHREGFIDIFRMNGARRYRVRLEMGILAYNLLTEEYPLAERDIRKLGANRWLLDTQVADYAGVGRFVATPFRPFLLHSCPDSEFLASSSPSFPFSSAHAG